MNEIEELKQELKQTQLAYQMATQMSKFKAGFLAQTSHELRSPLSSLIGLHQLILADLCESPEEQKEFISQAYQSALKLMKLIDEIVAVSKTEIGTNQLQMESLQLEEILTKVESLTHLQAANRNLKLAINVADTDVYVYADRSRLIQSIVNLIESGISLMKEGAIAVNTAAVKNSDPVEITIDLQCSPSAWQKEAESFEPPANSSPEEIKQILQEINLSPKMKLLLSQTLLETMGGSLKLLDFIPPGGNEAFTRLILTCQKAV